MERLDKYKRLACELGMEHFKLHVADCFLLKRPSGARTGVSTPEGNFDFATQQITITQDPLSTVWQVLPLVKKVGNPFPDRLSIGRANNCDLVIRLPFISKVHAHLLMDPNGSFSLKDNGASNGTCLNFTPLRKGEARAVSEGDIVTVGRLDLELMSVEPLYELVKALAL